MLSAERLFAERGVHGVSLREIGLAAGQRNNNVIPYHFGDRAGLVAAIYAFRSEVLDCRRFELLDELARSGKPDDAHTLLTILLRPHAESVDDDDNQFLGFLTRLILDAGSMSGEGSFGAAPHMSAHRQIRERLRAELDSMEQAKFDRRFELLLNFAITALSVDKRRRRATRLQPIEELLEEVVDVMVAGLHAGPRAVKRR
jgi:AcrR family transcriptional regulator